MKYESTQLLTMRFLTVQDEDSYVFFFAGAETKQGAKA